MQILKIPDPPNAIVCPPLWLRVYILYLYLLRTWCTLCRHKTSVIHASAWKYFEVKAWIEQFALHTHFPIPYDRFGRTIGTRSFHVDEFFYFCNMHKSLLDFYSPGSVTSMAWVIVLPWFDVIRTHCWKVSCQLGNTFSLTLKGNDFYDNS